MNMSITQAASAIPFRPSAVPLRASGPSQESPSTVHDQVDISRFDVSNLEKPVTADELREAGLESAAQAAGAAAGGWFGGFFTAIKGFFKGLFSHASQSEKRIEKAPAEASPEDVRKVVTERFQTAMTALVDSDRPLPQKQLESYQRDVERYFRMQMRQGSEALDQSAKEMSVIQRQANDLQEKKEGTEAYLETLYNAGKTDEASFVALRVEQYENTLERLNSLIDMGNNLYEENSKNRRNVMHQAGLAFGKVESKQTETRALGAFERATRSAAGVGEGYDNFSQAMNALDDHYNHAAATHEAGIQGARREAQESGLNQLAANSREVAARGSKVLERIAAEKGWAKPASEQPAA